MTQPEGTWRMGSAAVDLEGMVKCSSVEKRKLGLKIRNRSARACWPFRFHGQVKISSLKIWRDNVGKPTLNFAPKDTSDKVTFYDYQHIQFSRSVVSDSLRRHEPQHARPPCPSPTPGVHPNLRPSSWWCHTTISSSVIPFSCPQSLPGAGSLPMSQLFTSGGQSTGVSASASVFPMKEGLISFRMDWLDLLAVQGTLKSLLQHHSSKASILQCSAFFIV